MTVTGECLSTRKLKSKYQNLLFPLFNIIYDDEPNIVDKLAEKHVKYNEHDETSRLFIVTTNQAFYGEWIYPVLDKDFNKSESVPL